MARLILDINKSLEQNASIYYEKAKKFKKKIEGAKKAVESAKQKLDKLEQQQLKDYSNAAIPQLKPADKEWYEKFRWFISSEGFFIIGGRDATTNEIIIKKHTSPEDLVFHTDLAGSPFFVIKTEGKKVNENTLKEVADATVTFSRVWKMGLATTPVFYVKPEQVTKQAKAGEYLTKGAFMIYGKTNYIENKVNCAVGMYNGKIMAGPLEAVRKHCEKYVVLDQGREKASDIAKYIQKQIGSNLDDIIRVLPSGGCKIKK